MAVGSDEGAFGLGDLHQVHANAGQADGLGGRGAGIGGGHLFEVEEVDATDDGGCDEKCEKAAHESSFAPAQRRRQGDGIARCATG